MSNPLVAGTRVDPTFPITDPRFVYVSAAKTDVTKTFALARARMAAEQSRAKAKQDTVRELRRAK
jgi:hypothetical protein